MARTWFTEENTSGLDRGDLAILNRAARSLQDARKRPLRHIELVVLRTEYKPGMSANDLLAASHLEK